MRTVEVWTLEEAKEFLALWLQAQAAVATGQSYKIGTRSLERANLSEILGMIRYWRNEVQRLQSGRNGGMRIMRVVPRDL